MYQLRDFMFNYTELSQSNASDNRRISRFGLAIFRRYLDDIFAIYRTCKRCSENSTRYRPQSLRHCHIKDCFFFYFI